VKRELELDLLGSQAANAKCMVFVYKLDGDDGRRGFERDRFADTVVGTALARFKLLKEGDGRRRTMHMRQIRWSLRQCEREDW